MDHTLESLPGLDLILPIIVDSLDIKSICQLRYVIHFFFSILIVVVIFSEDIIIPRHQQKFSLTVIRADIQDTT